MILQGDSWGDVISGQGGNVISSEMVYKWQVLLRSRSNWDRFNGLLWEMRFVRSFVKFKGEFEANSFWVSCEGLARSQVMY